MTDKENEIAIKAMVQNSVKIFAHTFSQRHIAEVDNQDGVINSKIHNVFIAALGTRYNITPPCAARWTAASAT